MDGVTARRLRHGELVIDAVESVSTVAHPIRPRDEWSAVCPVGHPVNRIGVEYRAAIDLVFPDPAADLHDRRALDSVTDLVLATGRRMHVVDHDVQSCVPLCSLRDVQSVSLGRRLVALVIDWFVAVLSAAVVAQTAVPPEGLRDSFIVSGVFIVEVGLLVGLLGFSIGKRLAGLRVEGHDGGPIGVPRALLRTFLLSLVIPALVMTDERRGLHDLAAGSRVIRFQSASP